MLPSGFSLSVISFISQTREQGSSFVPPSILTELQIGPRFHSAPFLMRILCVVWTHASYLNLEACPAYLAPTFAMLVSHTLRTHFSSTNLALGLHFSVRSPKGHSPPFLPEAPCLCLEAVYPGRAPPFSKGILPW